MNSLATPAFKLCSNCGYPLRAGAEACELCGLLANGAIPREKLPQPREVSSAARRTAVLALVFFFAPAVVYGVVRLVSTEQMGNLSLLSVLLCWLVALLLCATAALASGVHKPTTKA